MTPRERTVYLDRGSVRRIHVIREARKTTLAICDRDNEDEPPLIEAELADDEREGLIDALADEDVR